MQQVTLLPSANHVYVDGVCQIVDLSGMDPSIHAVQWSVTNGTGEIEYVNDIYGPPGSYKPPQPINSIAPYQSYIDAWTAASAPAPAPTLAQLQANQIATLRQACAVQIVSGAQSSALGSPHTYPTDPTSQLNMAGSVTASLLPGLPAGWTTPFWCADSTGNWTFTPHTAAQIQQVGQDIKASVVAAQTRLAQLTAQVNAATTPAAVAAIVW